MPVCSWISRPQWWLLSFKKKLYVCWKGHAEIVCTPVCLKSSSRMLLFFVVLLPTFQRIGWHFPVCLINCHLLERVICVIYVYLIAIYLVDQVISPSDNQGLKFFFLINRRSTCSWYHWILQSLCHCCSMACRCQVQPSKAQSHTSYLLSLMIWWVICEEITMISPHLSARYLIRIEKASFILDVFETIWSNA